MMASIRDYQALGAIPPHDIAVYLRGRGWSKTGERGPIATWEKMSGAGFVDIDAPLRSTWRDYGKRVQGLISVLADVEGRSELDIFRDISIVSYDVVRLIARGEDGTSDGSIPLADGMNLVSAGKGSLLSAACAAIAPKRAYHTRKPPLATAFAESLRMGQSERGSYIVTVLSRMPAEPLDSQMSFCPPEFAPPAPEIPFARRVTQTLAIALVRLRTAATTMASDGDIDVFEKSVEFGVSADLCESVALVRQCSSVLELEVNIGWALVKPVTESIPSKVVFPHNLIEVIGEAGRLLREREPVDDFEMDGPVIQVTRPEETLHGKATMYGMIDGAPRKVSVELWGDDWQKATKAMAERERLRLHCIGKLERVGRTFVLNAAKDVRIIEDETD